MRTSLPGGSEKSAVLGGRKLSFPPARPSPPLPRLRHQLAFWPMSIGLPEAAPQPSPYHLAAESVRPKHKRPRKGVRDQLAPHGYTTLGPIASGAFATVAKAVHRLTGKEVAVKSFLKKRKSTTTPGERALGMTRTVEDGVVKGTRELEVLRLLAAQASLHPGVAHLLEVVESSRAVHAVLEYCAGGSLSFLLSSRPVCSGLEEEQAAGLFAQACCAYGSTTCRTVLLLSIVSVGLPRYG